ncbi:MAG: hypothetical protein LBD51_00145 [Bifidobacteriaceae bacterium]|jgi:hypothetical protein|nr:hypothetical protein [Bifidobacteriaceae bacterium]
MSRSRFRSAAALVAGGALLVAAHLGGATSALWASGATAPGQQVAVGQVYVAATRAGGAPSVADGANQATLTMTTDDAVATASGGALIEFSVTLRGEGNTGVDYYLTLGPAASQSIAASSRFAFYERGAADSCANPGDATARWELSPGQKVGPFAGQDPNAASSEPAVVVWCLAVELDPGKLASFANSASATGTSPGGAQVGVTDSWSALVLPSDPAANGPYQIAVEPVFTRPGHSRPPAAVGAVGA